MINLDTKNIDFHAALAVVTENVQSTRSLLPESGADVSQYGRSMIEMLGVLAIIGVLSVGGIAGYSKAMQKYRINKTIEQITLIAGNIRTFFAPQGNYNDAWCYYSPSTGEYTNENGDTEGCPVFKKAKIFPEEMLTLNSDGKITAITNAFGTPVSVEGYKKGFYISCFIGDNEEACIELMTHDWSVANVKSISVLTGDGSSGSVQTPVSIDTAVAKCSTAISEMASDMRSMGYVAIYLQFLQ